MIIDTEKLIIYLVEFVLKNNYSYNYYYLNKYIKHFNILMYLIYDNDIIDCHNKDGMMLMISYAICKMGMGMQAINDWG